MADQVSVGYFRNFRKNTIETSVEFYFKKMNNIVDFKDNAMILLNKEYEGEIRIGEGTAYGVEFYSRFDLAPFSGWISYTYARSERTVEGINDGKTYLSPYDRPHDVTLVMNYDINKQLSVGLNWVYMTGNPVTFPTGRVEIGGKYIPIYSERNTYRMPDYHRMDFSLTFKGKDKPSKRFHSEWNFSVYNAYARKNAWVINFIQDENDPNVTYAEKTYLFSIIPSLTYNFFF
jgi:outer membrane receptor protein involved in Fe transport